MASKQELEAQVLNLQREVNDLTEKLERASAGLPPASPDEGKLALLQEEYARQVDRNSELSQALGAALDKLKGDSKLLAEAQARAHALEEEATQVVDQLFGDVERVSDAKEVHDLVHNRNIDWDHPVAILKRG